VSLTALERVLALPADVIAVGPGLGTGDDVQAFVAGLLDRASVPLVLDADALNAFADDPGRLSARQDQHVAYRPILARQVDSTLPSVVLLPELRGSRASGGTVERP